MDFFRYKNRNDDIGSIISRQYEMLEKFFRNLRRPPVGDALTSGRLVCRTHNTDGIDRSEHLLLHIFSYSDSIRT